MNKQMREIITTPKLNSIRDYQIELFVGKR